MPKPKLAIYGAASCGGCDVALLNLHEHLLEVAQVFEIVFWPTVMDGKYKDLETLNNGELTLSLISGSIRTDEMVDLVKLLRTKSQLLIALGSCAQEGCIPGLANLSNRQEIFATVFNTPSTDNPNNLQPLENFAAPEGILHLPVFTPLLRTLDQVVAIDYTIPGCPPESEQIWLALQTLMAALDGTGPLPAKGTIIGAGVTTVCDECPRTRNVKKIKHFVRLPSAEGFELEICLLEQGLPCNGPATRNGCGALCPRVNAACIGCYGAAEGVIDYGARLMSAYASVIDAETPAEIDHILDELPDPVGQFYRFSLAGSLLRAGRQAWIETKEL